MSEQKRRVVVVTEPYNPVEFEDAVQYHIDEDGHLVLSDSEGNWVAMFKSWDHVRTVS